MTSPLTGLLCLLLPCALHAAAAAPKRSPQDVLRAMELVCAEQRTMVPADARALDEQLRALAEELRAQGLKAVPLLAWHIRAKERPLKARVYSAAVLGMIGDPGALPALKAALEDAAEDPGLRSTCLQSMGSLGLGPRELRPILDRAAGAPYPEPVVREALSQLAWLGSDDLSRMEREARRHGPAPEGLELGSAAHAVAAIGRSDSPAADEALFRLLRYFKKGSPLRGKAVAALNQRHVVAREGRLGGKGFTQDRIDLIAGLITRDEGSCALQAARLLGALGDKRATPALVRDLRSVQDPEVLAEIAEALAAVGDPAAAEALRRLDEGLVDDPRFKPSPEHGDPREHALRIQAAARLFSAHVQEPIVSAPGHASKAAVSFSIEVSSLPFRYEGWPGAGRPKLAWDGTADSLPLRSGPSRQSPVTASARLSAGQPVEFDGSVVVTSTPGRARARRDVELEARLCGEVQALPRAAYDGPAVLGRLSLKEGETLELLSYREEGQCFLRRGAAVYLGPCPQNDRSAFSLLEEPAVEWWLHTRMLGAEGWFDSEQQGLEFLPRW